jgi:hypothetical protein
MKKLIIAASIVAFSMISLAQAGNGVVAKTPADMTRKNEASRMLGRLNIATFKQIRSQGNSDMLMTYLGSIEKAAYSIAGFDCDATVKYWANYKTKQATFQHTLVAAQVLASAMLTSHPLYEKLNKNIEARFESLKTKKSGNIRLTVKAIPSSARIRILNIGPKYSAGMKLKPGRYHIEASQPGYERKREWITLGSSDLVHVISLSFEKFVLIPSGSFSMGGSEESEKPVHTVHVNSFRMSKYEITQSQWKSVMGSNPSRFKGSNNPVEKVSWDDIQGFIRKLNSQTGQRFRLPSEAEWEYAARAGTSSKWSWGNSESSAGSYAWYRSNSGNKSHPVGQKQPNGYGLYDMHGNVWEWVQDCWNGSYSGAPTNGSAWLSGTCSKRVLRGGSWFSPPDNMRSANRDRRATDDRYDNVGFRLVQD